MDSRLTGALIGISAAIVDQPLKNALNAHADMIDITWVDIALLIATFIIASKMHASKLFVVIGLVASAVFNNYRMQYKADSIIQKAI